MNLNTVASLVREDLTTIAVTFSRDLMQTYTFKCTQELAATLVPGEKVLVRNKDSGVTQAVVSAIHSEPKLDINREDGYKWAFQKVETDVLQELEDMDTAIEAKLQEQQRTSARQQVLGALGITDPAEFIAQLNHDKG